MLSNFRFHHIGYVTDSIMDTAACYAALGYQPSPVIEDKIQRVYICFLTKKNFPRIELVEPVDEKSSLYKLFKSNGVAPYHVCYEVDNIDEAADEMIDIKGYTLLFRPVEAIALDNRMICYLYRKETGYIELVNKD